jgi:hypothetical protein
VLVALSLAVLAGFGARRLLAAVTGPAAAGGFAVIVAAAVVNVWPVLRLQPVWQAPPPVYGSLAGNRDAVLAEFPFPQDYAFNTQYMYFSLWHWASMVNGYSGFMPKSYDEFEQGVRDFPGPHSIETMKARGVTHVTVNCGLYRGGCDELLATIDGIPDFRRVADGLWEGKRVRLYELRR